MRCLKIRKFENIFCYKHNKMILLLSVRSNILQEDINHGKTVQFRIKALASIGKIYSCKRLYQYNEYESFI